MDKVDALETSTVTKEINMEDLVTEDHSSPEDPFGKFDKSPQHQTFQSLRQAN